MMLNIRKCCVIKVQWENNSQLTDLKNFKCVAAIVEQGEPIY